MKRLICANGHFVPATNGIAGADAVHLLCPVCWLEGTAMSLMPDDHYTRALLPGVFGVREYEAEA